MTRFLAPAVVRRLLERILGESSADLRGLLLPRFHQPLVASNRAALIISRVRLVAALFAFLSPLWIALDVLFFPTAVWIELAAGRVGASVAFAVLSLLYHKSDNPRHAYYALAMMFVIPTAFYWYSHLLFSAGGLELSGLTASMVTGYAFLPFVMVAGLAVFPLTAVEGALFALPSLVVEVAAGSFGGGLLRGDSQLGLVWLFLLIAAVAVLAAMSQLHYLSEIVIKSSHDPLTGAFNRGSGEELLEKYFTLAIRNGTPLALIYIDLDDFKGINDRFGHEAGDEALRGAASAMMKAVRREDLLVRWGGEEFLMVLPHAREQEPATILGRLAEIGLGRRPDGLPVTASMGQAEFLRDRPESLAELLEVADRRMYRAKREGKNRVCFGDKVRDLSGEWIAPRPAALRTA